MKAHLTYTLIVLALILALAHFIERSRKLNDEMDRKESVIAEKTDSIKHWKNSAGQAVAEKVAAQVSTKELKEFYKSEIDQIREELGIKDKNLRAFVKAEFAAHGEGSTVINNQFFQDSSGVSVERNTFMIADGYLTLDAILDSTEVNYKYNYKDELLTAFEVRRSWVFGKEKLFASGRLKNKNAMITNSTSVMVDNYKDRRFVVVAGASWLPFNPDVQFWPTLTVGYALIKF